jgi:hypothetical protein
MSQIYLQNHSQLRLKLDYGHYIKAEMCLVLKKGTNKKWIYSHPQVNLWEETTQLVLTERAVLKPWTTMSPNCLYICTQKQFFCQREVTESMCTSSTLFK